MDKTAKELLMILGIVFIVVFGGTVALDYWDHVQHGKRIDAILGEQSYEHLQ